MSLKFTAEEIKLMMCPDFATHAAKSEPRKIQHVDAPFGYYGSKQHLASQIAGQLPPHNAWVEAFCGSASITLAKTPAMIEVVNDIDSEIFNFFKQLRENTDALCQQVVLTPYSRQEYEESHKSDVHSNDLERARRFLVSSMMTVNGVISGNSGFSYSQSYSRNGCDARVNRWINLPDKLIKVADRLRNVRLERKDARDLLKMFLDRPATLIYLDPPYLMDRDYGYRSDVRDQEFHIDLLRLACRARCMVLISGYSNALYDSLLTREHGWVKELISTSTRDTTGKKHLRTEVLWKNTFYEKARKSQVVPIRLTSVERKQKKINPIRKQ